MKETTEEKTKEINKVYFEFLFEAMEQEEVNPTNYAKMRTKKYMRDNYGEEIEI